MVVGSAAQEGKEVAHPVGNAKPENVATPLLDRAWELYQRFIDMGLSDRDVAAMVDVIGSLPRTPSRTNNKGGLP